MLFEREEGSMDFDRFLFVEFQIFNRKKYWFPFNVSHEQVVKEIVRIFTVNGLSFRRAALKSTTRNNTKKKKNEEHNFDSGRKPHMQTIGTSQLEHACVRLSHHAIWSISVSMQHVSSVHGMMWNTIANSNTTAFATWQKCTISLLRFLKKATKTINSEIR